LQKFINVDPIPPAILYQGKVSTSSAPTSPSKKPKDGRLDNDDDPDFGPPPPPSTRPLAVFSGPGEGRKNSDVSVNSPDEGESYAESDSDYERSRVVSVDAAAGLSDSPQYGASRKTYKPDLPTIPALGPLPDALMTPLRAPQNLMVPRAGLKKG